MLSYHFHGIHVQSGIPLGLPLVEHDEENPNITSFGSLIITQECSRSRPTREPIWIDPAYFKDGTTVARLYKEEFPVMELTDCGYFHFVGKRIEVDLYDNALPAPYLLGRLFGLWMELQGIPMLHGGCILHDGDAIGFLADSGMGKSTLGAALFNKGFPLLTDDLIPLVSCGSDIVIAPGIPMARIWPDSGEALVNDFESADKIHPLGRKRKVLHGKGGQSRFATESGQLRALFILERRLDIDRPRVEKVVGAEALTALIGLSYRPEPLHALGMHVERLSKLAAVMGSFDLYRLHYPSGYEHLDATCLAMTSQVGWPSLGV